MLAEKSRINNRRRHSSIPHIPHSSPRSMRNSTCKGNKAHRSPTWYKIDSVRAWKSDILASIDWLPKVSQSSCASW